MSCIHQVGKVCCSTMFTAYNRFTELETLLVITNAVLRKRQMGLHFLLSLSNTDEKLPLKFSSRGGVLSELSRVISGRYSITMSQLNSISIKSNLIFK